MGKGGAYLGASFETLRWPADWAAYRYERQKDTSGMVGFIQSSKDVDQALQMLHRYGYMQAPMIEYRYTVSDVAVLEVRQNKIWTMKYPEPARQANDFLIAIIVNTLGSLAGKHIVPLRVELTNRKCGRSQNTGSSLAVRCFSIKRC